MLLMLAALEESTRGFMEIERPAGGLFIWATLPEGYDGTRLCKIAGAYKVAAVPGASFCVDDGKPYPAIRLNSSFFAADRPDARSKRFRRSSGSTPSF